mmetsp:Transcript_54044/g.145694  ORF Transcript_54044/g.145694 Transcript_54044/m.145694 type:complete len:151 (-) Transcript_54044:534-986(-)
MAKHRWTSDLFEKYFPTVYYDRGCALPSTENEQRDFWNAVALAKSIAKQGPQLKLMRCFSFDEVAENWAPDFFVNRIVLESACSVGDEDGEEDGKVFPEGDVFASSAFVVEPQLELLSVQLHLPRRDWATLKKLESIGKGDASMLTAIKE